MRIRIPGLLGFCVIAFGLVIEQAHGYEISLDCEYGHVAPPGALNPNLLCEFTWENEGPAQVRWGSWTGMVHYLPNPNIRDTFISPVFAFYSTTQPLIKYIRCTDVSGIHTFTAHASSLYREIDPYDRANWKNVLFDMASDYATGELVANGC